MASADNLLSGLIGAVIGGMIVALNDRALQRRQNRRVDQAAGRLVCLELVSNYYHVENLAAFAMDGKQDACIRLYSDRAWGAEQTRIASLLAASELDTVFRAYMRPPAIFHAVEPLTTPQLVTQWLQFPATPKFVGDALADTKSAVAILKKRAWPWWSRRPDLIKLFEAHVALAAAG